MLNDNKKQQGGSLEFSSRRWVCLFSEATAYLAEIIDTPTDSLIVTRTLE